MPKRRGFEVPGEVRWRPVRREHGILFGLFLILIGLILYFKLSWEAILITIGILIVIRGLIMWAKEG